MFKKQSKKSLREETNNLMAEFLASGKSIQKFDPAKQSTKRSPKEPKEVLIEVSALPEALQKKFFSEVK